MLAERTDRKLSLMKLTFFNLMNLTTEVKCRSSTICGRSTYSRIFPRNFEKYFRVSIR